MAGPRGASWAASLEAWCRRPDEPCLRSPRQRSHVPDLREGTIPRPTLTIDNATTLHQVKTFLDQNAGDKSKLYAKQDQDGNTILYMKSGAGLSNLLKGKADIKRDAARTIMRDMADNAFNALPTRSDNLRRQLTNLGTAITGYFFEGGAGDLRASDTRSVLEGLSRLNTRLTDIQPLPQGQLARVTVDNPAVNLTSLGDGFTQSAIFADARDELATGQLSNTRKTALANDLGDAIAAAFRQQNQGAPAREAFALSSGETLRGELAAALGEGGGAMPDLDQVLEGAFLRAASRVADNQAHETTVRITPTVGNPYDAPEMTVGGILYTPVKDLGEGGFAHVVLYREKDPPQDGAPAELAIKLPKEEGDTPEEVLKNLKLDVQEFQLHRTAVGDGNDNVMNGGDFVRLPGGRLALTD